ncbi:MAG: TfoX/Sxy family DNA transformation protein [Ideonella sp.]|nr:TfoX/Sxy family DNA transformation protein [Ideonella sp.]
MPDLASLPNLGPASAQMLRAAGLSDVAQLRAFAQVRRSQPQASLNLLWALEGALTGLLMALEEHEHRSTKEFSS